MIFHINYPLKRKHEESNLLHSFPFEPVPPMLCLHRMDSSSWSERAGRPGELIEKKTTVSSW